MTALQGVRVLELGQFIAGPYCAQILGDHGAEVIKVERPGTGDAMRRWGVNLGDGPPVWWPVIGRNKKSVVVDLKQEEGRDLVRRLALTCDVIVENFRPGTLERLGIGPDDLLAENPRLVVARISGFGQTGPYSKRAGFGGVAEAMGGLRFLTGEEDRPPVRVGLAIGDTLAGLYTAFGILAALRQREITGLGQVVDTGLTDAVVAVLESVLPEYSTSGVVRHRSGNTLPGVAPSNTYPTQDGHWVVIGANADGPFERLCDAMGVPELASDPRLAGHEGRGRHQRELDERIEGWTRDRPLADILAVLEAAAVPAGPVNTAQDVAQDPHFRERGTVVEVETEVGRLLMQGVVPRLTATPGRVRWAGPALGAHTAQVLRDALELDERAIAGLAERHVVELGQAAC